MISTWTKIDPTKNCFRFYAITMASDLFNAYVVSCEWGRIGNKRNHRKVEVFFLTEHDAMDRYRPAYQN